jgi:hypothetical protein
MNITDGAELITLFSVTIFEYPIGSGIKNLTKHH